MVWVRLGIGLRFVPHPPLSRAFTHSPHHSRGRMASGTVSCHRIYNVPPSAHSSSLGPSLAHVEGRAPCSPHCHCSGGHGRNGRCVAIKVTNNMPVNRRPCRPVNRGVPYHAESALSSAQESSANAGALLNEHLVMHGLLQPRLHRGGRLGCPPQPFHLANQLSNPGCTALTRP